MTLWEGSERAGEAMSSSSSVELPFTGNGEFEVGICRDSLLSGVTGTTDTAAGNSASLHFPAIHHRIFVDPLTSMETGGIQCL